jgi:hypothetical protein
MSYQDDLPPNVELTTQHTVHRSASKAYSRPPDIPGSRGWPRWALPVTTAIACISLGVAIAAVAVLLSWKSASTAQADRMQNQLATVSSQLQAARTANSASVGGLAAKVSSIDAAMAALAQFNQVCSQDLTGANGPAQFFFLCTDQKP